MYSLKEMRFCYSKKIILTAGSTATTVQGDPIRLSEAAINNFKKYNDPMIFMEHIYSSFVYFDGQGCGILPSEGFSNIHHFLHHTRPEDLKTPSDAPKTYTIK